MAELLQKRLESSRRFRRFGRLQLRAMTLLSAVLVGFVTLMLATDFHFSNRSIEHEVTDQAIATARTVAALVADRLASGKLASATPVVTTMVQYGDIESIEIVDVPAVETLHVERSHFHLDNQLREDDLAVFYANKSARRGAQARHQNDRLEVTLPLFVNEEPRGVVRTISTNDFPSEKRREALQRTLIIASIFLAVVLPSLFLVVGELLRPINELTIAAKEMTKGGQVQFSVGLRRDDEIGGLARSFKRMTAHLARSMAEERRLAYVDPVTGLSNRERMRRAIEKAAEFAPGADFVRALLFIDLDGFKRVNDMLGHDRGDKLLEAVSRRFEAVCLARGFNLLPSLEGTSLRAPHLKVVRIGRLGGDEFVILARFKDDGEAAELAASIIEAQREPFMIDGNQMEVGASIGIARIPGDGCDVSTLMRHADLAMYDAKEKGGRRYCHYSDEMGQRMLDRLILEMELRRAIGIDEIEPFFMPKVHLSDGRLYGFEALARWRHPTKGMIQPDRFIPIAERTGVIAEIDRIVMRKAVLQAAQWFERGLSIPVAVNVSPLHLERSDFVSHIERLLKETGLPGHLLELEITETAAMKEGSGVLAGLALLKARGVRLAIDDFGTGYSNFAQLHKIPANVIKIDGGLVRALGTADDSHMLIKTVVALAQQLKLDIVAEGIDTMEKHEKLAKLGCTIGQGYLYAPPMPIAKTETWLAQHSVKSEIPALYQENRAIA